MMGRRWLLLALAGIALVLIAGRAIASSYVDHLWYEAVGGGALWRTRTFYTTVVVVGSAVLSGAVIFLNLYAVRRSIVSLVLPRRVANIEIGEEVPGTYLMAAVIGLSMLFGVLLRMSGRTWQTLALAIHGVSFGETDPYFKADLGFFVYWVPFETALHLWALITLLAATALVVCLYALTPSLRVERGTLHVSAYVRRHLSVIASLLLLLLAWTYRLDGFELVIDGSVSELGFGYADRHFGLRAAPILAFLTVGAALVVLWTGWVGQLPIVLGAVSVVLLLSFILKQVVPALDLGPSGPSDIIAREEPFSEIRELYSEHAFAVDDIVTADGSAGFQSWAEAARGVPTWDNPMLARALGWSHRPPPHDAPVGISMAPFGLLATTLIPPSDSALGTDQADTWVLARARAARADTRGGPVRVDARGLPAAEDELLSGVLVYPGARAYSLVIDSLGADAAPYLNTLASRVAHAWSLQNFHLLLREQVDARTTIVTRRDVAERVRALVPFLAQGSSVSSVIVGDSLYWILELYSSSTTYPLSTPVSVAGASRKYFQHSATAVVAAATGRVRIVRAPKLDPILRSWESLFPSLFTTTQSLPRGLIDMLPPVHDGALAQSIVFARFGTRHSSATNNHLASRFGADTTVALSDLTPAVLPISNPATTWMRPVLDTAERVVGIMLATGGSSRVTRWVPVAQPGPSWSRLLDRIQVPVDTTTPPRDTRLVRGPMRAFPMAGSIAFTQTTYAWRANAAPTVARVAVLAGDSVGTGPTFAHAAGVSLEPDAATPLAAPDFRARVDSIYAALLAAMRRGDWVAFGEAMDALGVTLAAPRPLVPPPSPR
jgi:uncharacterized membrane protein (UPF0182 family)